MDFHILREPGRFLSRPLSFFLSLRWHFNKNGKRERKRQGRDIRGELRGDKSPLLRHRAHLAKTFRVSGMFLGRNLRDKLSIKFFALKKCGRVMLKKNDFEENYPRMIKLM